MTALSCLRDSSAYLWFADIIIYILQIFYISLIKCSFVIRWKKWQKALSYHDHHSYPVDRKIIVSITDNSNLDRIYYYPARWINCCSFDQHFIQLKLKRLSYQTDKKETNKYNNIVAKKDFGKSENCR